MFSKEGREDKCSPIVYIAESCMNLHEDNADFVKWVQHQQYLHILEVTKTTINIQFVLNDEMHHFFAPLPGDHNIKNTVNKRDKDKG
jgi:hypothetical protein